MMEETGASTGAGRSGGRFGATVWIFSVTICRARKMSVPHSNSTQMTEIPCEVEERTRRTPVAPFTEASIGNVTSVSTSSGAMPWASARMVTVGAVRSGNTSTGRRRAVHAPPASSRTAPNTTSSRLSSDHRMSRFNIV